MRYYTDYITPQHRQAEKFTRHIALMTHALVDISALASQLNAFFGIDNETGKQLDVIAMSTNK